jgi:hypothetical protein
MKIVLVALAAVAALLVYIRFAPLSAARWDIPIASVDPADHGPGYLVLPEGQGGDATSPAYDLPPAELGRRVMDVALGEWRTVLLAG